MFRRGEQSRDRGCGVACVRQGTGVLVPGCTHGDGREGTPLGPPASGGKEERVTASARPTPCLPAGEEGGTHAPRPFPPACGGKDGHSATGGSASDSRPVRAEGWDGVFLLPRKVASTEREQTVEDVYDLELENAHSFLTDVCAVHQPAQTYQEPPP